MGKFVSYISYFNSELCFRCRCSETPTPTDMPPAVTTNKGFPHAINLLVLATETQCLFVSSRNGNCEVYLNERQLCLSATSPSMHSVQSVPFTTTTAALWHYTRTRVTQHGLTYIRTAAAALHVAEQSGRRKVLQFLVSVITTEWNADLSVYRALQSDLPSALWSLGWMF